MIEFSNVLFTRNQRVILDRLSFRIGYEERVAVLGASGEGKTTILRLIMRLMLPDDGAILIDGSEITGMREEELREIRLRFSIVFQEGALFDSLNVKENVAFFLREYTKMTEEEIDRQVRKLLRQVSVEPAIDMMPEELSGGMQRRVAIARSLAASSPRMFLYDEPTSDLDPVNAAAIRKLILDLSGDQRGFILVTHEIFDALQLAQRFMFLNKGVFLFDGTRDELLESTIPEVRAFIDAGRGMMR